MFIDGLNINPKNWASYELGLKINHEVFLKFVSVFGIDFKFNIGLRSMGES